MWKIWKKKKGSKTDPIRFSSISRLLKAIFKTYEQKNKSQKKNLFSRPDLENLWWIETLKNSKVRLSLSPATKDYLHVVRELKLQLLNTNWSVPATHSNSVGSTQSWLRSNEIKVFNRLSVSMVWLAAWGYIQAAVNGASSTTGRLEEYSTRVQGLTMFTQSSGMVDSNFSNYSWNQKSRKQKLKYEARPLQKRVNRPIYKKGQ